MIYDQDPLRRRPGKPSARRKQQEGGVWMAEHLGEWHPKQVPIAK